ncbi:hypothetical protein [Chryseobacterium taihuense]|uniref:Uncharacterized protein n=1 Tax=Chryseobacterium taihuense TaxID=1141221 RepID=A0ABY0R387_9FLAO|nr:hypothetical protein [Chryseobacterium taihuense]SDM35295.1 hypothetical protein SAMN05216273_12521 [Chryseobacterium taihuense]
MQDNFIEALNEIKEVNIVDEYSLKVWKSRAVNIIVRIYGNESKQEEQIKSINFRKYISINGSGGGNNSKNCNEQAKGLIDGFINDIKRFGLPKKEKTIDHHTQGINITLNQNQQQNQSIKLNVILEALQDELNGKQLKEIQEIIDNNESIEEKKDSIINKITSFGSGLASNILANILTNPELYS